MYFPKNTKIGMLQYNILGPQKEGPTHIDNFRAAPPILEQTFVELVNAGQKPGRQLRM